MRITFHDFEATPENATLTGATVQFVTVRFTVDGQLREHATVSVACEQGRRQYDLVEDGPARARTLDAAIVAYVREAERLFRAHPAAHDRGDLERTYDV